MNSLFPIVKQLAKDLPPLAVCCDFPYGPVDRIAQDFLIAGLDVSIVNLSKDIKAQSEYHSMSQHRQVIGDGNKNFLKLKVFQKQFERRHPLRNTVYDTFFSNFDLHIPLKESPAIRRAGILFWGNVHGLVPHYRIPEITQSKAGILWISTAQPLTGYCLYTAGCQRWQTSGCMQCPQLGLTTSGKDECRENFILKKEAFSACTENFYFVTPSKWLCQESKKSLIANSICCKNIMTSVQLHIFTPQNNQSVRKKLGISPDTNIILIGSAGQRKNKGFHVLCTALANLADRWKKKPTLLFFGYAPSDTSLLQMTNLEWKALGWIGNPEELAQIYSAADVFVSTSFQDNLPNTVNEALSCGTPVICFDRWSSEEVVLHGRTGLQAKHPGLPILPGGQCPLPPYSVTHEQCRDLAEKIFQLLSLPTTEREILRQNCRIFAEKAFSPIRQTVQYLLLYRKLLGLPEIYSETTEEPLYELANTLKKVI